MNPNFTKKLGFRIHKTIVNAQKIDGSKLNTFGMVIALFFVEDKEQRSCFFKKMFLLADINIDITLDMFFFTLTNV